LQGIRIPSAILKIVFRHILLFCFLNAVWALTSGGFRIVSDTLVIYDKRYAVEIAFPSVRLCLSVTCASCEDFLQTL